MSLYKIPVLYYDEIGQQGDLLLKYRTMRKEVYHMEGFINYIKDLVKYFQDLIAYFRVKNDGKEDAVMPEFPRFVQLI